MSLKDFITLVFVVALSSCAIVRSPSRLPSSETPYPEFKLSRKFFFNKRGCSQQNEENISRRDYEFEEYKNETRISYYASKRELGKRFRELYSSKKRLRKRMYWDNDTFNLPLNGSVVHLNEDFLNSLAHQVEMAFTMNVVDYLFYPDMGHAHFYLPQSQLDLSFEKAVNSPELKLIYHTAEQLMMKDGPQVRDSIEYRQYRYRTRNLVGSFNGSGIVEVSYAHKNLKFNTLREVPGSPNYKNYKNTLYLSAHQNGCIGYIYKGHTYYFDISMYH